MIIYRVGVAEVEGDASSVDEIAVDKVAASRKALDYAVR